MIVDQEGNQLSENRLACARALGIPYEAVTDSVYAIYRTVRIMIHYGASTAQVKAELERRMKPVAKRADQ